MEVFVVAAEPQVKGDIMIKIMFVCHGNICRSPMAEFIMKDITEKAGLSDSVYIASSATSTEEIGNGVYPPVKRILNEMGISCNDKRAVQIGAEDYEKYDYIICMDDNNIRNIKRIIKDDPDNKIIRLMELTDTPSNVADPWYTGDFYTTKKDITKGCNALLKLISI